MLSSTTQQPKIDLKTNKKRLFNPLFYKLQHAKTRFIVNYGGAASGKSVAQHQLELLRLPSADYDVLFLRKYAADLYDSCYSLFKNLALNYEMYDLFNWAFGGSKRQILYSKTQHRIIFRGLDDPEKIKSIVGVKRIVMEEAHQFEWEDFLELNRRVRGMNDIQIILLLNPVSKLHWIKTKLIDGKAFEGNVTVIKTTVDDNQFATKEDIENLDLLKDIGEENQWRIYRHAEWGVEEVVSPFAFAFNNNHIGETTYDVNLETYLSFDFNNEPLTCLIAQKPEFNKLRLIENIFVNKLDIDELCERILTKYPSALFIITGDQTGEQATALKVGLTYYRKIKEKLELTDGQIRLPGKNPRHRISRIETNLILNKCDVLFDEKNCDETIYDMRHVEYDPEKLKIIKEDRGKLEQKADFLDCFRYLCHAFMRDELKYLGIN
ncbi:MAG: PBSX family phage terminase large subunit [Rhodospirillaceae bacterium]|nr:MAG: PBSX family phage terminase large subunit [Rhodospirillaceae bacterium]